MIRIGSDTFTLRTSNEDPSVDRCVTPIPGARYVAVVQTDSGFDNREVDADFLEVGQTVFAYGGYGTGDCFVADTIVIDITE